MTEWQKSLKVGDRVNVQMSNGIFPRCLQATNELGILCTQGAESINFPMFAPWSKVIEPPRPKAKCGQRYHRRYAYWHSAIGLANGKLFLLNANAEVEFDPTQWVEVDSF